MYKGATLIWTVRAGTLGQLTVARVPNSSDRDSTNYAPLSVYSTITNVLQIGVAHISRKEISMSHVFRDSLYLTKQFRDSLYLTKQFRDSLYLTRQFRDSLYLTK